MGIDPLSPTLFVDELGLGQDFQMMTYGGLGKTQGAFEIASADFARLRNQAEKPHPCRIGERLETLGHFRGFGLTHEFHCDR